MSSGESGKEPEQAVAQARLSRKSARRIFVAALIAIGVAILLSVLIRPGSKRSITLSDGRVLTFEGTTAGTNLLLIGNPLQRAARRWLGPDKPIKVFGKTILEPACLLGRHLPSMDGPVFWFTLTKTQGGSGTNVREYTTMNDIWLKIVGTEGRPLKPTGGSVGGCANNVTYFGEIFQLPDSFTPRFRIFVFQKIGPDDLKPLFEHEIRNPLL